MGRHSVRSDRSSRVGGGDTLDNEFVNRPERTVATRQPKTLINSFHSGVVCRMGLNGAIMYLKHIELTNFRCFESLRVPLERHLNVFVGVNGSGKSTILQGMGLILAPMLRELPPRVVTRSAEVDEIRLISDDRLAPYLHMAAVAEVSGYGDVSWDETKFRRPFAGPWTGFDRLEQRELREQRDGHPSEASFALGSLRRAIESMLPQVELRFRRKRSGGDGGGRRHPTPHLPRILAACRRDR
jgi:hypothetical protein